MPRTKVAPSRKRPLEESKSSVEASLLDGTANVADLVESAEVSGWRSRIASGSCRPLMPGDTSPAGLARCDISAADFEIIKQLHTCIGSRLEGSLTGWGGVGDESGRLRGYGYLPISGSLGREHLAASHAMKEYSGAEAAADRAANRRASVSLVASELPAALPDVLRRLTDALVPLLPRRYRSVVRPEMLIAAQPNLHRTRRYLRPHLDEPLHDGFGVVIVTVAISGHAKILLRSRPWDQSAREEYWFDLAPGQAYALSGDARNVCLHGVLADDGREGEARESLNLRFGLHDRPMLCGEADSEEGDVRFSAWGEIERHWQLGAGDDNASGTEP